MEHRLGTMCRFRLFFLMCINTSFNVGWNVSYDGPEQEASSGVIDQSTKLRVSNLVSLAFGISDSVSKQLRQN